MYILGKMEESSVSVESVEDKLMLTENPVGFLQS